MSILISILVALGSFLGYHGMPAAGTGVRPASAHPVTGGLRRIRPESGGGPVGIVRI